MKRFSYISATPLVIVIIFTTMGHTQTEVAGNVYGDWTADSSPYIVTGSITVDDGRLLEIEAGVNILFAAEVSFYVYGQLLAVGTEDDSICFRAENAEESGWGGLRFLNADRGTFLKYCAIDGGHTLGSGEETDSTSAGGNVFIYSGDVTLDKCRISGGFSTGSGGGIAIWSGTAALLGCKLAFNSSIIDGGALMVTNEATPVLENCYFIGNSSAESGGAVVNSNGSKATFSNCIFSGNTALSWGGAALVTTKAKTEFYGCKFFYNEATVGGALNIRNEDTSPLIEWCYFYENSALASPALGGALYVRDLASPEIRYCRFIANSAEHGGALYYKEEPRGSIHNNLFARNTSEDGGAAIETSSDNG
ncbi:right-handed parallel beta-helix repeat-containing protein, partial [Calditrichota bacterium]